MLKTHTINNNNDGNRIESIEEIEVQILSIITRKLFLKLILIQLPNWKIKAC